MATVIFFTIILGIPIGTAVWWWVADRRVNRLANACGMATWKQVALRTLVGFVGLIVLVTFGVMVGGRVASSYFATNIEWALPKWMQSVAMIWGLMVLPAVLVFAGVAGLLRVGRLAFFPVPRFKREAKSRAAEATGDDDTSAAPAKPQAADGAVSRRDLLRTTLAVSPAVFATGAAGVSLFQLEHFRIREMDVKLASLPAELDGLRIAHLTDSHVGRLTQGSVLDEIVGATNDLAADLVTFTGDLINHNLKDLPTAIAMLDRIDRRSGMFIVEGNHDLFHGREPFAFPMIDAGLPLMDQRSEVLNVRGKRIAIHGMRWTRDDFAGKLDDLLDAAPPDAANADFSILLNHHPHTFDAAADRGIDLTLAGHTHGGQLNLGPIGFGPAMYRYWSGLYERDGKAVVVSNGVGNWFPIRIGTPAEIVCLTLRTA